MSPRPPALPRTRARLTARAGVLAVIVVMIAVLSIVPLQRYLQQRARIAELEHDARLVARANAELTEDIDRLQSRTWRRRLARECLGMVEPGETAFVVVPERGDPRPSVC
jgi:cell division protein FtsB